MNAKPVRVRQDETATRSKPDHAPTKGHRMSTVTGRTAIIGIDSTDAIHTVVVDGEEHVARDLARLDSVAPLSEAAYAEVLSCLECGQPFSAVALYAESPVPGECRECAWDLLAHVYDGVALLGDYTDLGDSSAA